MDPIFARQLLGPRHERRRNRKKLQNNTEQRIDLIRTEDHFDYTQRSFRDTPPSLIRYQAAHLGAVGQKLASQVSR